MQNQRNIFKKLGIGIGVFLSLLIIIWIGNIVITQKSYSILSPQSEQLTELYFEKYDQLPRKARMDTVYPFIFVIHNLENKKVAYPFEVTTVASGEAMLIARDSVTLEHEQLHRIRKSFSISRPVRTKVVVTLVDQNQSIHFWVEPAN